eukprot:scaffold128437_cov27-Tisochrysis_lutea.AAC.5
MRASSCLLVSGSDSTSSRRAGEATVCEKSWRTPSPVPRPWESTASATRCSASPKASGTVTRGVSWPAGSAALLVPVGPVLWSSFFAACAEPRGTKGRPDSTRKRARTA